MSKSKIQWIAEAAIVAALYAALTMALSALSYGAIQVRFSEALTVLPFFMSSSIPGLFIGCLIANLLSPIGPLDIVIGSLATLVSAIWTSRIKNRWLAPLPPVICNGILIGGMIAYLTVGFSAGFWVAFAYNALTVGLGELLACYILGELLITVLGKQDYFKKYQPQA